MAKEKLNRDDRYYYIRKDNKIKSDEELLQYFVGELEKSFNQWAYQYENGVGDPTWSDGTNLNLVRNHISYYRKSISDCCERYSLPTPKIMDKPIPDELPSSYMAKGRPNPEDKWRTQVEIKAGLRKKPEDSIIKIENHSQLKKALKNVGTKFKFVAHWRKDLVGQVRVVKSAQTNGVFNAVDGQPNHELSLCNDGRGIMLYFEKASQWSFKDGTCSWKSTEDDDVYYSFTVFAN